jgi:hypothetical protein
MSCVLLSLKVPVAVNCFVVPTAMLEFPGATASETSVALLTVREALPVTPPEAALMVLLPLPTAVANPAELTVATPVADEDHVTDVSSCVLPSSKLPTALNCCVVPSAIVGLAGLTAIEIRCAATTVKVEESENDPTVAVMVVLPAPTVVTTPVLLTVATEVEEELQVMPLTKS